MPSIPKSRANPNPMHGSGEDVSLRNDRWFGDKQLMELINRVDPSDVGLRVQDLLSAQVWSCTTSKELSKEPFL